MAKESKFNTLIICMFILIGVLAGSILSDALSSTAPFFGKAMNVGLNPPAVIDLYVFSLTVGFTIKFNLGSAIGAVIGYFVGKKVS